MAAHDGGAARRANAPRMPALRKRDASPGAAREPLTEREREIAAR